MTSSSRPGPRVPAALSPAALSPAALSQQLDRAAQAFRAGRLEESARLYREAERRAPDDPRAAYSLAVIDLRQGRLERARARLRGVLALAPGHLPAWHNLGVASQRLGDWSGAVSAYEGALGAEPTAVASREALAIALAVLGRTEEAVAQNRLLAGTPEARWPALTRIALLDPAAIDAEDLDRMRRAAASDGADPELRAGLWFAVGEVLDRRGEAEAAFDAFDAGNALKRRNLGAAAEAAARAHAAAAEHAIRLFTPEMIATNAGRGLPTAAPIFVVGFPRSGSTLVEQVLASHRDVQGMGETGLLPELIAGDPPKRLKLSAAWLRGLGERYLEALRKRGWDGRARVADKTLENYLHVGLIHLIFPNATVVESAREPMDACLSAYRQLFARGNETLYDLAEIGAEYGRYAALMDHWRAVLPGRVVRVAYESLATEGEASIRALLAAAGLPWDPAALAFHEREGPVATASAVQVRRPLYSSSVGRWRAHATRLGPLMAALGVHGLKDV